MILRLKCKSPISGVSYWPIKVRTGRGAPYSDFPKIMTVNLCLPTYKDKADPLLPPEIYFVSCICKGAAMAAQLFYRGTERKVKNTINYEFAQLCIFKLWTGSHNFTTCSSFFAGSPKKQMAGSRVPGGEQWCHWHFICAERILFLAKCAVYFFLCLLGTENSQRQATKCWLNEE